MKIVRIRNFSAPYFSVFELNMDILLCRSSYLVRIWENMDQKNSEYRHFLLNKYIRKTQDGWVEKC